MHDTDQQVLPELVDTGERMIPGVSPGAVEAAHRSRYLFAFDHIVPGAEVLDAGCGTGYGAQMLAAKARSVRAIDFDAASIAYARYYFAADNIEFSVGDCLALPFPDQAFDVVVSFEVIEHVTDPDRYAAELARVVKPEGVVIISTPLARAHIFWPNRFHVHEFSDQQLGTVLNRHFADVTLLGQRVRASSLLRAIRLSPKLRLRSRVLEPLKSILIRLLGGVTFQDMTVTDMQFISDPSGGEYIIAIGKKGR